MYTNIDTAHALEVIIAWLDKLHREGKLPAGFPLEAVKEVMSLVMLNKTFAWGDLRFLQLLRTAMGTSAVYMWAIIYFTVHESTALLPRFGNHLLLFCHLINEIFWIWIGNPRGMRHAQFVDRNNGGFWIAEMGLLLPL